MFHVKRNGRFYGTKDDPLRAVQSSLSETLPSNWQVTLRDQFVDSSESGTPFRSDAVLEISSPRGEFALVLVEVKKSTYPRDIQSGADNLRKVSDLPILIVAPYIPPSARDWLSERNFNYGDATGNLRLSLENPTVFVQAEGAQANPWRDDKPLASLKGPGAATAVRALLDKRPPFGIREIASQGGASLGTLSRVVDLLHREALLERKARGPIFRVDWEGVIRRWAEDYSFLTSNRNVLRCIDPRGARNALNLVREATVRYAVTGSLAAAQVAPIQGALAQFYVQDVGKFVNEVGLKVVEPSASSNVVVAQPLSNVVFKGTWDVEEITYVALPQVAVDLISSPGRGASEAEDLFRYMRTNEDAWRT